MAKEKTRQQMAREYGVSRRTFYNMLRNADIQITPGLVTPKEQQQIYTCFGKPASRKPDDG